MVPDDAVRLSVPLAPTATVPLLPKPPATPVLRAPALILVPPVCRLVPDSTNVPVPILVKIPMVAVEAPDMVKVLVVTSMVPVVAAVSVKLRSVLAVKPVYCSVPPLNTRFAAAFVA